MNMKLPLSLLVFCMALAARVAPAETRSGGTYTITADSIDGGGQQTTSALC
jgi:hypothetical protein